MSGQYLCLLHHVYHRAIRRQPKMKEKEFAVGKFGGIFRYFRSLVCRLLAMRHQKGEILRSQEGVPLWEIRDR